MVVAFRTLSAEEAERYREPQDKRASPVRELLEPLRFEPDQFYRYRHEYHLRHHFTWADQVPGETLARKIELLVKGARILEVEDQSCPGHWRKVALRFRLA